MRTDGFTFYGLVKKAIKQIISHHKGGYTSKTV